MRADTLVLYFIRDVDDQSSAEDVGRSFQTLVSNFGFDHFLIGPITASAVNGDLGISQQTVHKHISNALRKLRAPSRAHAIAIALSTRILEP